MEGEKDIHLNPEASSEVVYRREEIDGLIDIYEEMMVSIWEKMIPTLGIVTVAIIMERAINKTAKECPLMKSLKINEKGISFNNLKMRVSNREIEEVKQGFRELVANLCDILSKLTGSVLVDQLMEEMKPYL
jgi:hypothetical protein